VNGWYLLHTACMGEYDVMGLFSNKDPLQTLQSLSFCAVSYLLGKCYENYKLFNHIYTEAISKNKVQLKVILHYTYIK
jgi:hypothetical protein